MAPLHREPREGKSPRFRTGAAVSTAARAFSTLRVVTHASELIRAIASLAWPAVALVTVLLFRTQITKLLSTGVRRAKAGPFEMEWETQVSEVEARVDPAPLLPPATDATAPYVSAELRPVAERAPSAAVMEAYAILEERLRARLTSAGIDPEPDVRVGAVRLARIALDAGLITPESLRAIEGVAVLRNMAAHRPAQEIGTQQALEYLALIDSLLYVLSLPKPT
jgi:hypothetical protein